MINNELYNEILMILKTIESMEDITEPHDINKIIESSYIYNSFNFDNKTPSTIIISDAFDTLENILTEDINWKSMLILISHLRSPEDIILNLFNDTPPCTALLKQCRSCIISFYIPDLFSKHNPERFGDSNLDISDIINSDSPEIIGRKLSNHNDLLPDIIPLCVKTSLYILSTYNIDVLAEVLSNSINTLKIYYLTSCINIEDAIKIIELLPSSHVSKILTFYLLNNTNSHDKNFSRDESFFTHLFKHLYRVGEFHYWMKYINTYPLRFPKIQDYLGEALALIDNPDAVDLYLNSIELHCNSLSHSYTTSREPVIDCLKSFEKHSNTNLQLHCWKSAFKIWSNWNFNAMNKNHLFSVSASEIDYPVVQYFINNLNTEERQNFIKDTINKLSSIDSTWYSSKSDLISCCYRHLSSLQLPYHANLAIEKPNEGINFSLQFNINLSEYSKLFFAI